MKLVQTWSNWTQSKVNVYLKLMNTRLIVILYKTLRKHVPLEIQYEEVIDLILLRKHIDFAKTNYGLRLYQFSLWFFLANDDDHLIHNIKLGFLFLSESISLIYMKEQTFARNRDIEIHKSNDIILLCQFFIDVDPSIFVLSE